MPLLNFGGLDADGDLREQFAELTKLLTFLLNGKLDTVNIRALNAQIIEALSITGDKIAANSIAATHLQANSVEADKIQALAVIAGKIAANAVTATEIAANTITADKMNVTQLSAIAANLGTITAGLLDAVTIIGSIITGGTVRTAASGQRIELSGNQFKTFNSSNQLFGFVLGPSDAGFSYGDVFFYDTGVKVMEFYNRLAGGGYSIRPVGSASLFIGDTGKTTGLNGNVNINGGTTFDTTSQPDTSGLTLAQLEAEVNTLKSNLRSMNILA